MLCIQAKAIQIHGDGSHCPRTPPAFAISTRCKSGVGNEVVLTLGAELVQLAQGMQLSANKGAKPSGPTKNVADKHASAPRPNEQVYAHNSHAAELERSEHSWPLDGCN